MSTTEQEDEVEFHNHDDIQMVAKPFDPRKATDIVLSVEEQVKLLTKVMYSYDLNIKLVLDRVNKIYKYIERLEETERQMIEEAEAQKPAEEPRIIDVPANAPAMTQVEDPKEVLGYRRTSRVQTPVPASMGEHAQATASIQAAIKARQQSSVGQNQTTQSPQVKPGAPPSPANQPKHPTAQPIVKQPSVASSSPPAATSDRKIPVVQRLVDQTGKDIFMAEVSIIGSDNQVAAKVKTNALGKWQSQLKPGKYTVNIVKTDTTTKSKIEASQTIEVQNSNSAITLPVAIIKR
jgi:hypothetical protein